jgi:SAM-dependent methyltransferase
MSFPQNDQAWADTAAFLRGRMSPADRLVAPDPFRFAFPRARRFGHLRQETPGDLDWVVVHKGELDRIPRGFLLALPAAAVPVFANEVFVAFATSPPADLPDLTGSNHVRAFQLGLEALPPEAPPAFGAVTAVELPSGDPHGVVVRGARAKRPRREEAAVPPRPWLLPGSPMPGARREAALQAELDRLLADYLGTGRGLSVLDIGCGGGRLAPVLTEAAEVVGIDIAEAPIARARTRHAGLLGFAFARMDAARLGFADARFDAVVMLDVLDVLPDPAAALAEAARVLAPGGRLMVTATNKDSLPLRALRRLALPVPPGGMSVEELSAMLRAAGMVPRRMDGILLPLGWAMPGAGSAFATLEEDPDFIDAARILGRRCGPDQALVIAMMAAKA